MSIPVGIFAASSVVPTVEFEAGIAHLRKFGFDPIVHAQVPQQSFTFAGQDLDRAAAIYEYATDPRISILWAARGGYGAGRLLPILDELTKKHGKPPKKLLIGYSDVTALHEYVRKAWGWSTLHAPMPAASDFPRLDAKEWAAIVDYVKGKPADAPWQHAPLQWLTPAPTDSIEAPLIGGNLSLLAAHAGTPWAAVGKDKIIFLEDVDEPFYRIDRMIVQLDQAGILAGARAIVLGDFTNCKDESNTCLAHSGSDERKPLRKTQTQAEAWDVIFAQLGQRLGIPIAQNLGVGHGPHYAPLPLGAKYRLTTADNLELVDWDWLKD